MTESFSVYAKKIYTNLEDNQVTLEGFDLSQLIKEFNAKEILKVLDESDIVEHLVELRAEAEDE